MAEHEPSPDQATTLELSTTDPENPDLHIVQPIEKTTNGYLLGQEGTPDHVAELITQVHGEYAHNEGIDYYSEVVLGMLASKVQEIPPGHPAQERLIALLQAIQRRPAPDIKPSTYWQWLPGFFGYLHENETGFAPYEREEDEYDHGMWTMLSAGQWLNHHAFKASWYMSQPPDFTPGPFSRVHPNTALVHMYQTVELPRKLKTLNDNIPAAAVWFVVAGSKLRERCRNNMVVTGINYRIPSEIPIQLYKGPDTWNEDRWAFWKERFAALGDDERLTLDARQWASRAARAM
ncbi:hypothetical protein BJ166DRAFT_231801 [Pestalotiopsis sp. NC0098]|nr:hypothetical protein BJ166DRAFT_231801 [Pestalotiopsis sp. NC0098]